MAITKYTPGITPVQASAEIRAYIDDQLAKIAEIINDGILFCDILTAPPAKPQNGMIVYADGTLWNPGSGLGFYGYENGVWVKL